jgi:hypothetical protein
MIATTKLRKGMVATVYAPILITEFLQTIPHNGVGSESLAEGSKGILGLSKR